MRPIMNLTEDEILKAVKSLKSGKVMIYHATQADTFRCCRCRYFFWFSIETRFLGICQFSSIYSVSKLFF